MNSLWTPAVSSIIILTIIMKRVTTVTDTINNGRTENATMTHMDIPAVKKHFHNLQ
jgi:hypothetical protein